MRSARHAVLLQTVGRVGTGDRHESGAGTHTRRKESCWKNAGRYHLEWSSDCAAQVTVEHARAAARTNRRRATQASATSHVQTYATNLDRKQSETHRTISLLFLDGDQTRHLH